MSTCGPSVGIADFDKQSLFVNCGTKKSDSLTVQAGATLVCGQIVRYNAATKVVTDVAVGSLAALAVGEHFALATHSVTALAAADEMDFYTWAHDVDIDALTFGGLTKAQLLEALIDDGDKIRAVRPSHGGVA